MLDGQTWAQFMLVWGGEGERREGYDHGALRDQINRRRAAKGLGPMRPAATKPKR